MKIIYPLLFLALLIACSLATKAQQVKLDKVSEEQLRKHVCFLASDSLNGRGTGTPGSNNAADYIKEQLMKMNLSSPGEQFFQSFSLTSNTFNRDDSFISTLNRKGKQKKATNNFFPLYPNTGVTDIEGELVFAGFGSTKSFSPGLGKSLEKIKGKIVLYAAGSPESSGKNSAYRWDAALEQSKMDALFNAGAKALILVTSLRDTANTIYRQTEKRMLRQRYSLKPEGNKKQRNIFIVTPETADRLTGNKLRWDKTLRTIADNGHQNLVSLKNKRIHIHSVMNENEVDVKNVIGMVEGSDSLLKNQCIVFIAHYDHLGTNEKGEIYNGADDNASGVAALLEIARMFSHLPQKPKRSMMFLFPTAEEIGLLGSHFYSQNPLISLEKTIASINLDMVGRVYEERDSVWNNSSKQVKNFNGIYALVNDFDSHLKDILIETSARLELEPDLSLPQRFFYSSDHYHFHKNRVPVLNLSTGYTADYHKPTDTADRIRTDKMKRIVQMCFLLGMELGNR